MLGRGVAVPSEHFDSLFLFSLLFFHQLWKIHSQTDSGQSFPLQFGRLNHVRGAAYFNRRAETGLYLLLFHEFARIFLPGRLLSLAHPLFLKESWDYLFYSALFLCGYWGNAHLRFYYSYWMRLRIKSINAVLIWLEGFFAGDIFSDYLDVVVRGAKDLHVKVWPFYLELS